MLFLFNHRILELETPEIRLALVWRGLGCGDPSALRARDAVGFVQRVLQAHRCEGMVLEEGLMLDLASLLIAKTGANAALFVTQADGSVEPRLSLLPESLLRTLAERTEARACAPEEIVREAWHDAA